MLLKRQFGRALLGLHYMTHDVVAQPKGLKTMDLVLNGFLAYVHDDGSSRERLQVRPVRPALSSRGRERFVFRSKR